MWRIAAIALAVASFVYVAVMGVTWLKPRIEADLESRVATSLAMGNVTGLGVSANGRTITLTGDVSETAVEREALTLAARVFGVAKVVDELTVGGVSDSVVGSGDDDMVADASKDPAPSLEKQAEAVAPAPVAEEAKPYTLTINKTGDKIVLTGAVPDEATRKRLIELAATHYGESNVSSALTVVEGAPAGWLSAAGSVVFNVVNLENATATLSQTEVMVSGDALDGEYAKQAEAAIHNALPANYKLAYAVDVATPTVAAQAEAVVSETAAVVEEKVETAAAAIARTVEPAAGPATSTEPVKAAEVAKAEAAPAAVAQTSATGCQALAAATRQSLLFGFDKAAVTGSHQATLRELAQGMKDCSSEELTVAGYTDATGSKLYNQWLSEQRAESAKRALIRGGVGKDRLHAVGYGDAYPVEPNTTKAGRAKNRRVDFHLGDAPLTAADHHVKGARSGTASSTTVIEFIDNGDNKDAHESGKWWDSLNKLIGSKSATTPSGSDAVVSPSAPVSGSAK